MVDDVDEEAARDAVDDDLPPSPDDDFLLSDEWFFSAFSWATNLARKRRQSSPMDSSKMRSIRARSEFLVCNAVLYLWEEGVTKASVVRVLPVRVATVPNISNGIMRISDDIVLGWNVLGVRGWADGCREEEACADERQINDC